MSDTPGDIHDAMSRPTPSWGELRARTDHADKAYEFLNSSPYNGDPHVVKAMIEAATVHAQLAVADKLEELTQTIKFATGQILDAQAKLDEDIKTAANYLHQDAHELKVQLRVIKGERAA